MMIVFGIVIVRHRFVFAETEVATTAATTTAIASRCYATNDDARLTKKYI